MSVISEPEYIERKATVELLRNLGSRDYRREKGTIQDAIKMVSFPEYTPSADVAPVRHGHIVTTTDRWATYHQNCSECSEELPWKEHPNFCHNCGAKLDLEG